MGYVEEQGYVEEHRILRPEQHGFLRGRFCESQVQRLVDEVSETLEKGCQEDVLIMDFSKAFEPQPSCPKFQQYGISGTQLMD